jgi:hypothetical protein
MITEIALVLFSCGAVYYGANYRKPPKPKKKSLAELRREYKDQ